MKKLDDARQVEFEITRYRALYRLNKAAGAADKARAAKEIWMALTAYLAELDGKEVMR